MKNFPKLQGFTGKLPAIGDFVKRGLPPSFLSQWESWLQSAIAASREQLGDAWLDVYLFSPIWRFGLSPGVCGENAWAGVLMPSVDKVNRHYPFTLAFSVNDAANLVYLFGSEQGGAWFRELEKLALSGLDGVGVDAINEQVQTVTMPRFSATGLSPASLDSRGKCAFHIATGDLEQTPSVFMELSANLLSQFMPLHSLWSPLNAEGIAPSLIVCEGLPPDDRSGQWTSMRMRCSD